MFLIAVYIVYSIVRYKKKTSTFLTYSLKIFSLYALLLNTILTIPFFEIFIGTIFCNSDDNIHANMVCYSGLYFLHLTIAIFGMIFLISFTLMFTLLYIDINPNSTIPFAAPQSKLNLLKLIIKFLLPLYIVVDFNVFDYILTLVKIIFIGKSNKNVYRFVRYYLDYSDVLKIQGSTLL